MWQTGQGLSTSLPDEETEAQTEEETAQSHIEGQWQELPGLDSRAPNN